MMPDQPGLSPHRGTTVFGAWASAMLENFHETPSRDAGHDGIWCYAGKLSYLPGETLDLHISTTSPVYDLLVYRDGASKTVVHFATSLEGRHYPAPADCSVKGCNWPVAVEISIPLEWRSGGYIVEVSVAGTGGGTRITHHFPVIIRAPRPSADDAILVVAATGTWVAYNDWGGSNFYEGITGADGNKASPVVSTQRPFSRGFAWLPEGAPRIPLERPPKPGAAIRYPHMEWAYANGFSKKYASAGWASYERHFVRWAEAQGYSADVATQHDLHAEPKILAGYKCIVFVGHDEYWSWQMRDAVDAYVNAGGHVARFAGNFTWQIRIEDEGRTQVCYKDDAAQDDPVRLTSERHLLATAWDDPAVGRPGTHTFGLTGTAGVYAGWGGCVPRGSGGFTVYRPEHWVFAGSDLYYGDQLGAEAKIFGYEVDGCDYEIRNGLPHATGTDGAPETLEIVALGLATVSETDHGNPGSSLFIADWDAIGHARRKFGKTDEASVDSVRRGAGMIAYFGRGEGGVLNAASCEWVAGLIARDPFVERVTHNVLQRFIASGTGKTQALEKKRPHDHT